jgi:hypothetical protein
MRTLIVVLTWLSLGSALGFNLLTAQAAEIRTLNWDDLVPDQQFIDDPFATLTQAQFDDLSMVAFFRLRQSVRPEDITESMQTEAEASTLRLQQQHIDIDDLLDRRATLIAQRQAQAEAVVPALDGQSVRIPGYLLPLDFSDEKVTEFLLVPTIGACIHVPPPPANQMVHVRYGEGFAAAGLYEPVWVEGILKTESMSTDLSLVDGSAEVASSYTLQAAAVSLYQD